MSTLAVIVIVVVAALLLAMLVAAARLAMTRAHRADDSPYRSHAEASRRSEG